MQIAGFGSLLSVDCRLSALDLKETCETIKAMLSIVPTSVFEEISKKMKQLLQATTRKYVQLTASFFFLLTTHHFDDVSSF